VRLVPRTNEGLSCRSRRSVEAGDQDRTTRSRPASVRCDDDEGKIRTRRDEAREGVTLWFRSVGIINCRAADAAQSKEVHHASTVRFTASPLPARAGCIRVPKPDAKASGLPPSGFVGKVTGSGRRVGGNTACRSPHSAAANPILAGHTRDRPGERIKYPDKSKPNLPGEMQVKSR